ncbi:DUF5050 domain-containing protein [Priestia megaterium]|nr:DUF5050 domain-containing protein [Priestia megaterium]
MGINGLWKEGKTLKHKRTLFILISLTAILFAGSVIYSLVKNDDTYQYFTGLGSSISISPDDKKFVFSYFINGNEAIYSANMDSTNIEKLSHSNEKRYHAPQYSRDGKKLVYLGKDTEKIDTLYLSNSDGTDSRQLTNKSLHIAEAVFSATGETIYFIGVPAEDFKKREGEQERGFDLYSIDTSSGKQKRLTDKNHFSMNSLSSSPDGKQIFYTLFEGENERLYSFSIEGGTENAAAIPKEMPRDLYHSALSPDGNSLAFTAVSKESQNSSLYEYELFVSNLKSGKTKQLTNLNSSIESPVFFHQQNKIAFLEHINWPADPAQFTLSTIDIDTKKVDAVTLNIPAEKSEAWLLKSVNRMVNIYTIGGVYTILLALVTVYVHFQFQKKYLIAIISLILSIITLAASFVVAALMDPWYGIGVGGLAAGLFICTIFIFIFSFLLGFVKRLY